MGARVLLLLCGLYALLGNSAAAQARRFPARFGAAAATAEEPAARVAPGRAFLASALLPGGGQALLGENRWVPYAALELWAWISYLSRRDEADELAARYRDLAWSVARRISVGRRRDGGFEYYEALTKHAASGAFDRDPERAGLQPELDAATFNGSVWALARDIFFPANTDSLPEDAPAYLRALDYYERNATTPEFAWDWGDNGLEQEVYAELIDQSDATVRRTTTTLGLILANHMISAVDALITARLRLVDAAEVPAGPNGSRAAASGFRIPVRLENTLQPYDQGFRWQTAFHLSWPGR